MIKGAKPIKTADEYLHANHNGQWFLIKEGLYNALMRATNTYRAARIVVSATKYDPNDSIPREMAIARERRARLDFQKARSNYAPYAREVKNAEKFIAIRTKRFAHQIAMRARTIIPAHAMRQERATRAQHASLVAQEKRNRIKWCEFTQTFIVH